MDLDRHGTAAYWFVWAYRLPFFRYGSLCLLGEITQMACHMTIQE